MRWILALIMLTVLAPKAHAYLDPGSGSAILQGVLGALAALGLTLKLYWHRILRMLGLRKPTPAETSDTKRSGDSDS